MRRQLAYSVLRPGGFAPLQRILQEQGPALRASLEREGVQTFSVFAAEAEVCLYYETAGGDYTFEWGPEADEWLEAWPGKDAGLTAVPMIDIFHDGVPEDPQSWRGGRTVEKRVGSVAMLKPEQFASYVFYHYQLQEEKPEGFNKTYIIGSFGTLLFSYQELPAAVSGTPRKGLLDTSNTPDNWHSTMEPHFVPWENAESGQELWRPMELIFSF
ncbi:hypothetical protein [Paenibacillus nasutitermitis]|uniref:Uncharacterized protein n=1 Tax=Paenibacillus nasutitermitis TaxID=1652958 RepID=A0A916Z9D9_9BACL|nr:hypothetical protein [Paenibacillus nasutitermitis]GGD81356.1 hypothetical protein GCM10010911_44380 [Paenibacillus nasutitermitis]